MLGARAISQKRDACAKMNTIQYNTKRLRLRRTEAGRRLAERRLGERRMMEEGWRKGQVMV